MNNFFQLTFTLKQHTPLINFQWEQTGSTLRPTEFKSKLDKWIIASETKCYLGADERLKAAKKHPILCKWLKGEKKEHPAFDYSVTLYTDGVNLLDNELNADIVEKKDKEVIENADYKPYFGNQMKIEEFRKDEKKIKRLSLYTRIYVKIDCAYLDLTDKIAELLPYFLLHTNFGTRKSKGFGSFYLDINDPLFPKIEKKIDENFFNEGMMYGFDIIVKGNNDQNRYTSLFETIDLFYKTLRSGINPSDKYKMYFKSLMWNYAKHKTQQWDKKTLKEKLLDKTQQSKFSDPGSPLNWNKGVKVNMSYSHTVPHEKKETHLLWRDLLGLSSLEQWLKYNRTITKVNIDKENGKVKYTRFSSPLFFKPLRTGENSFRIYFEVPENIFNSFKENPTAITEEAEILGKWFSINGIEIPYPNNFDYKEFLDFAMAQNIRKIVKTEEVEKSNRDGKKYNELYGKVIKEKNNKGKWIKTDNPYYLKLCDIYDQIALQQVKKSKQK